MTNAHLASKSATRKQIFSTPTLLAMLLTLFLIPAVAAADSNGVNGFAICGTYDPTSSYYVPGDPVYLSDIFQVKTDSPNYELAFKNFLKQKYGWNKNVSCSVAYASDGATKTFNEKIKQAGAKLVRTGWTLASAGASAGTDVATAAGSPSASDINLGNSNWVCRVSAADGKDYNSDIFKGSDAGYTTFPTVFGQFVQSKYKVKFLSAPTCTNYGVLGLQQAQEALKGYASYATGVNTGWKYTTAAVESSASPVPAAASNSGFNGSRMYWVCTWAYGKSFYVSDAFGADYPAVGPGELTPAFMKFVVAKYGAKPYGGSCIYKFSEADAQALLKHELAAPQSGTTAVATGWRYGMSATGAAAQVAAAPASNDTYWVCELSYYKKTYVSAVIPIGAEGSEGAMGRLNKDFRGFLVAQYKLPQTGGSETCLPLGSEAQGSQRVQTVMKGANGQTGIATGWKPGMQGSGAAASASPTNSATSAIPDFTSTSGGGTAPAGTAAPVSTIAAAPAPSEPASPVTTNITVRLVDAVNSSTDQPEKHYRAVVTQAATAGSVEIPLNTLASITLAQQSPGTYSAQLVSLKLNGQDVAVTSTVVTATSMAQQAQQAAKKIGGMLSGLGKQAGITNQASTAVNTAGSHVTIPPGTSLTFSTTVPQPSAPGAQSSAPSAAPPSAMTAAAPAVNPSGGQVNGEQGPNGQIIGGTTSGVMTAYSCSVQTIPEGAHRQISYITNPFNSAQPQQWITFWFSQYIHQTYNIPANIARFTIGCNTFGNKTPAQQQATVNASITSWKQHDNDVVQLNWVPTQTPTPGVSVGQLNPMTGQMVTGGIGSNLPPNSNPAGSVALCAMSSLDGKEYISSIFAAGNHQHSDFEIPFTNYLATKYNSGKALAGNGGCQIVTQAHAQAMLQQWKKDYADHKISYVETGWAYNGPEAGPVPIAQTSPPGYVLCTTNAGNDHRAFTSAIFKGGSEEHLVIEQAFLTYLATKFGPNVPHNTSCVKNGNLADPQRYLYAMKNQAPGAGIKVVETGWTYNGAAPVTASDSAGEHANSH